MRLPTIYVRLQTEDWTAKVHSLTGIAPHLPYIRRYARVLAGSQEIGDNYVRSTLSALASDRVKLRSDVSPRVALYRAFEQTIFSSELGGPESEELSQRAHRAMWLMAGEGFSPTNVAHILGITLLETLRLADPEEARHRFFQYSVNILIIEDDVLIASDLADIMAEIGHSSKIASSGAIAVSEAATYSPKLILADVQLEEGLSGIDAVREILASLAVPVIFVTAYPERLLLGERPEPAYLITKPYQPETVKAAVCQALYFHAREHHEWNNPNS